MARALFRLESPDNGNQVNLPHALNTPGLALSVSSSREAPGIPARLGETLPTSEKRFGRDDRSVIVLLDLSGDKKAAIEWATARFFDGNIKSIDKAGLKWTSKREALARVRALRPEVFLVFSSDLNTQSGLSALMMFAV